MTLATRTKLGSYEITAAIGAGGMGEVYRAHDTKLGRDVALKVLPEAFAPDAERMARFQREAKVLASLDHPNIASIYGLEDSSSTHALVMQLVEGPTLADRIQQGPIPIDEALRIAKQICEALEYAHERGIVHRDLKPANIKVTNEDAVKVLDFGLAKAIEGDPSSIDISTSPTMSRMATMQGVLLGTAAYMSPEQAKAKPVDRRADIWAFGCVLYEMLTGKMAFSGETVTDTLAAVIKEEPNWSLLPASTPLRIRVLLERCLRKDPKQRLRDIGDARISLDEVLSGSPKPTSGPAIASPAPSWCAALPWSAVVLLAIIAAFFALLHFREKPPASAEVMRFQFPLSRTGRLSTRVFALSPDGRLLAFTAPDADGVLRLWVRPLDSLEAHELTGSDVSPGDPPFFWSPDSRYLAYDGGRKLQKIDVSGGPAQTLCNVAGFVVGGSWNKDGVILFGESPGVIMRVSPSGGTPTPLTSLDRSRAETQHVLPWFLPDGRHFLYFRTSGDPAGGAIYVGSIDLPPQRQDPNRLLATDFAVQYVPSSNANEGQLLFLTSDGTLMSQPFDARGLRLLGEAAVVADHVSRYREYGYFSASNDGKLVYDNSDSGGGSGGISQLTWFDRQGKNLGAAGQSGDYREAALSPDGTRAVLGRYDAQDFKLALWIADLSRRSVTRFTFDPFDHTAPVWSADGRLVYFNSDRNGEWDIYEKPSNGAGDETLLLRSSGTKTPCTVSHDGRFLIYAAADPATSKFGLWALPLAGATKPFAILRTQANAAQAQISPDDRWMAYISDESGRNEIYVRPFSPDPAASGEGEKWQISYGGGQVPKWTSDGKELYYLTPDWKVMEVDVTEAPTFQGGTPRLLFQAPQPFDVTASLSNGNYTIDGKHFLFLSPTTQTAGEQTTIVLNWQAGLKPQQ
jgi:eukaryotic-like serine/threonine-protein kinase